MPGKSVKVLIVEDEKMLADMYATKFTMEGYAVEKAADGAEGIELAKKAKPDIILLDVIMPKVDGFTALKELKSNPALKAIPVIMLTNLGQEDDVKKGKELGATDYYVKSNHSPSEIVKKVKDVLSKK